MEIAAPARFSQFYKVTFWLASPMEGKMKDHQEKNGKGLLRKDSRHSARGQGVCVAV